MPSKFECRDIPQELLHNIETGYMLKSFPFGSSNSFAKTTLKSSCYEVDRVNRVLGLPQ